MQQDTTSNTIWASASVWTCALETNDTIDLIHHGIQRISFQVTIISIFSYIQVNISIVKMDIEIYEWTVLQDIISAGGLTGTTNLVVEFHLAMLSLEQGKEKYLTALKLLKTLLDLGYQIFWTHQNHWCQFVSNCKQELRTNCHEVSFVRIR